MDSPDKQERAEDAARSLPRNGGSRRVLWALGLLIVASIAIVLLGAYRQPELLLNFMGLRYCG